MNVGSSTEKGTILIHELRRLLNILILNKVDRLYYNIRIFVSTFTR